MPLLPSEKPPGVGVGKRRVADVAAARVLQQLRSEEPLPDWVEELADSEAAPSEDDPQDEDEASEVHAGTP